MASSSLRVPALAVALCTGAVGCLQPSYAVEQDELRRLARTPPERRGDDVRVTQRLSFESDPVPASESEPLQPGVDVAVGVALTAGDLGPEPRPGRPRRSVRVAARGEEAREPTVRVASPARGGDREREDDGDDGDAGDDGDDDAAVAAAVVLVVASAGTAVALAATEGARFDGWVDVSPSHPLHLIGPDGEQAWVPLAGLDPELAAWADHGILEGAEGALYRGARAPLDRVGFTFGFELGAAGIDADPQNVDLGFAGRTTFGAFPWQRIGLLAGLGVDVGGDAVLWRPHLELQAYPLQLGRLHVGFYGQGGYRFGEADRPDGASQSLDGWVGGGGALLQLDVTTRFAVTLRAGASLAPKPDELDVLPEATLGVAIY